jgi:hypothetical protein
MKFNSEKKFEINRKCEGREEREAVPGGSCPGIIAVFLGMIVAFLVFLSKIA